MGARYPPPEARAPQRLPSAAMLPGLGQSPLLFTLGTEIAAAALKLSAATVDPIVSPQAKSCTVSAVIDLVRRRKP